MTVRVSAKAEKQLMKVPNHIKVKFEYWCDLVLFVGLSKAREYKGFHDEPLKGKLRSKRSIRLSKAYRAIYTTSGKGSREVINVIEVNKHEY